MKCLVLKCFYFCKFQVSSSDSSIGNFNNDTEQLITDSPHSVITCASFCLSRSHHNANQNSASETHHYGAVRRRSSCQIHPESSSHSSSNITTGVRRILDHRAYQCISIEHCESLDHRGRVTSSIQTIVTLTKVITPSAMQNCLRYSYYSVVACGTKSVIETLVLVELFENL